MQLDRSDFIRIPAGDYTIGISGKTLEKTTAALHDPAVKKEFISSSYPAYTVRLETVYIRKYLTSYREFSDFCNDTGYVTEGEKEGWGWIWRAERWQKKPGVTWKSPYGDDEDERYRSADHSPVMQVSWNDAMAYCGWLSGKEGVQVRLPSEAEWEVFAMLAGVPGMEEWAGGLAPGQVPGPMIEAGESGLLTAGADPAGILWEWTEDWYDRYPGGSDLKDYGTVYKVLRGGSLLSLPVQRTREFRLRKCPTARSPYYGFRIACAGW